MSAAKVYSNVLATEIDVGERKVVQGNSFFLCPSCPTFRMSPSTFFYKKRREVGLLFIKSFLL